MTQRIGIIGMGRMGGPMGLNLLKAGFTVSVYNRDSSKCRAAVEAGATRAVSVDSIAVDCDVLILMLADGAAVRDVVLRQGVIEHARKGLLVIDCSTVHPNLSRELAVALGDKGMAFLDAPVTGSRPQAEAGKLFFLVGGPKDVYERAIPLFEAMGRRHIHLGGHGAGACVKLCNNLAGLINLAGFCEALTIGRSLGVEPQKIFDVISDSGGRSAMSDAKGPKMLRGDWSADFALALAHKDLNLAQQLADQVHATVPMAGAAAGVFEAAKQAGEGEYDLCALLRWYEKTGKP